MTIVQDLLSDFWDSYLEESLDNDGLVRSVLLHLLSDCTAEVYDHCEVSDERLPLNRQIKLVNLLFLSKLLLLLILLLLCHVLILQRLPLLCDILYRLCLCVSHVILLSPIRTIFHQTRFVVAS